CGCSPRGVLSLWASEGPKALGGRWRRVVAVDDRGTAARESRQVGIVLDGVTSRGRQVEHAQSPQSVGQGISSPGGLVVHGQPFVDPLARVEGGSGERVDQQVGDGVNRQPGALFRGPGGFVSEGGGFVGGRVSAW